MMNRYKLRQLALIISISVLLFWEVSTQKVYGEKNPNISEYFNQLYTTYASQYNELKMNEFREICDRYQINMVNKKNQDQFFKLLFIHDLFTGMDAADGTISPILKIGYFTYDIKPNPREEIIKLPEEIPLVKVKNIKKKPYLFREERLPSVFLKDMVSEAAGYQFQGSEGFYTYGWSTEKEMSFCMILRTWGYECQIRNLGNHAWTSVLVEFSSEQNGKVYLCANVDNTFDVIYWRTTPDNKREWPTKPSQEIKKYNQIIQSKDELKKVLRIQVEEKTRTRINTQVKTFIENKAQFK